MKRLFENQLIHFSVVLMTVALACGLLIGAVNSVTAPIIEDNRLKAELKAYEDVLPGIASFEVVDITDEDPSTVQNKIIGLDESNNVLGYIYVVNGVNRYGNMTIVVSVGTDSKVIGAKFLEINQTLGVNDTRTNLQQFVGRSINDAAPRGDLISGVTGSTNTLISLMGDVAISHGFMDVTPVVPSDIYNNWFDQDYTREADTTFNAGDKVISREVVNSLSNQTIAYIYEVRASGEFYDGNAASITIYVGLDLNHNIIGVLMPAETYGHSKGGFMTSVETYVSQFVGVSLADIQSIIDDMTSGATNSKTLINVLLEALKDVVLS